MTTRQLLRDMCDTEAMDAARLRRLAESAPEDDKDIVLLMAALSEKHALGLRRIIETLKGASRAAAP